MSKKKRPTVPPSQIVALYDYNPLNDEVQDANFPSFAAPEVNVQLSFIRGETLEVISKTLDWWLVCKSSAHGKEGYVPSVYFAPLCNVSESCANGNGDLEHTKLVPCVFDKFFDLKYFPNAPEAKAKLPCPEDSANIFSRITFWWMNNLIVTGFKRPLVDTDVWELQKQKQTHTVHEKFDVEWKKEIEKWKNSPMITEKVKEKKKKDNEEKENLMENANQTSSVSGDDKLEPEFIKRHQYKPSITKSLVRAFGKIYALAAFFKLIHDSLLFVSPFLLGKLINFVKQPGDDNTWGYIYALILFVTVTFQSLALHQYFQNAFTTGMLVRSALLSAVYKKMLKLSNAGRREFTAGSMVNLMSVDAQKGNDLMIYLNLIWSGPFQILVALGFLYNLMGVSVLAGFAVLLLLMPLNIWVSSIEKKIHTKQMLHKDARSKLMNEVLAGIKVLKLYAWEESFISKVMGFRNDELKQLKKAMYLKANYSFTLSCTPFFVSCATFAVYVLIGNDLTAEKAFVSIALFNIIRFPLFILPMVISNIAQYIVSVKRISKFLKGEELDTTDITRIEPSNECENAITIKEGSFTWTEPEKPVLTELSLNVPCGSLTAIVGQVGTGKTSLLSAILGEIRKINGEVCVQGHVAYVAQQAWIQNQTLRENVLFGKRFNTQKYQNIIEACSLKSDLDVLPIGDMTEIGEKGINLSGGQKQRVSLARAVYNNSDIYLLDDPLSAVDAHVGKHIFENVIGPNGLLKNKTRLLVTHNLSFLPHVDQIIVLKKHHISEVGTYDELVRNDGDFAEFLRTYHNEGDNEEVQDNIVVDSPIKQPSKDILDVPDVTIKDSSSSEKLLKSKAVTASTYSLFDGIDGIATEEAAVQELLLRREELDRQDQQLFGSIIQEETSETGRVKSSVFVSYAKSIGVIITIFVVLFGIVSEALLIGSRIWLADWSTQTNITNSERDFYLGVYGGLGLGQGLAVFVQAYALAFGSILASKNLHNSLLWNVMRCPMSFFETTPMGRIVNRFSKDINIIDEIIPRSTKSFITTFMTMLGTIFVISYSTPIFVAVLVPIAFLYVLTQRFYVASSRQLKRIESVKRSPIYNHFFESINGASTIRAYGKDEEFVFDNESKIDDNQATYYPSVTSNRWLAMRLEFCGNMITFFAAMFCIIQRNKISAGMVGLSISYALQVTQTLNWLVRMTSEIETNIISVERVKEYIECPTEAPAVVPENRPKDEWPQTGTVTFQDYSVRYRPELDLVLKGLSFNIGPTEKIGVVGRTGAGKSSTALALFRIIESAGGSISIDGIEISSIGLKDLRSKLTIIPQDPVLFSGSLRFNLDPFEQFTDADLWNVLKVAHLSSFVSECSDGLSHEVAEGGENLSVGQRQLVCLARALLRKTKILVLDEATAAVDMETDALIQETIRKEFSDCTILTIAHRLNTILDYDRILVLSAGNIAEFDSPTNLLSTKGIFYGMAKDSGLVGTSASSGPE